jgi:hypothetical protein
MVSCSVAPVHHPPQLMPGPGEHVGNLNLEPGTLDPLELASKRWTRNRSRWRHTRRLIAALRASLSSRSRMFELPLDHGELSTNSEVVFLLDGETKYTEPHLAGGDEGANSLNDV